MINSNYTGREPGEQQKVTARPGIIVRPRAHDGVIVELRHSNVEAIEPEMFVIIEDNKGVASRLTGLGPTSVMAFGTADQ